MSNEKSIQLTVNGKEYTADFGHVWFLKCQDEIRPKEDNTALDATIQTLYAGIKAHAMKNRLKEKDAVPAYSDLETAICDLTFPELTAISEAINPKKEGE